ncbi:low temperature requirement protein A [Streptomyces tibetensis]|uniref:low temperature requirement protein A n=1 Tax=Streptomyces tibetensis TaxID=2382123 RepID=UPI0033D4BBAD
MLLAVMLVGLFMNAAIPRAFNDAGWVFVATFLLIHIGRTVWLLRVGLDEVNQEHFVRVLIWFITAVPLWLTGAVVCGGAGLAWWVVAALVGLAGDWTVYPLPGRRLQSRQVGLAGGYLLERGRLFMIIALGETVMTTGTALTAAPHKPVTLLTAGVAFTGTIALFWLFFGSCERVGRHYEWTEDAMRAGRSGVISLMASVTGLIAAAVADERVIAHPMEHAGLITNLLLFGGGPGLFIATQSWHGAGLFDGLYWSRLLALSCLVVAGMLTLAATVYLAVVIAAAIVVVLAALEERRPTGDAHAKPTS